jgi:enamine deaminase RidA (YjgF/YER057c/UK114 family)
MEATLPHNHLWEKIGFTRAQDQPFRGLRQQVVPPVIDRQSAAPSPCHRFTRGGAMLAAMLCASLHFAIAQTAVTRIPLPNNSPFPISEGVWAGDTLYLSGSIDSSVAKGTPGDTETQTVNILKSIETTLESQHLTLADVVLMHAYLAGDPVRGGKMDFAGFMAGYTQFFGTKDQPNKPARSAMQVAALALPGALVEIEVIAVNSHGAANPTRAALGK